MNSLISSYNYIPYIFKIKYSGPIQQKDSTIHSGHYDKKNKSIMYTVISNETTFNWMAWPHIEPSRTWGWTFTWLFAHCITIWHTYRVCCFPNIYILYTKINRQLSDDWYKQSKWWIYLSSNPFRLMHVMLCVNIVPCCSKTFCENVPSGRGWYSSFH